MWARERVSSLKASSFLKLRCSLLRLDGKNQVFRSLAIRNYRIWFLAAFLSNIGGWMQATAQSWVVLTELTQEDAFAVGITMSLQFGPQLFLVPIVGVVVDKMERRTLLFMTQSVLLVLSVSLGILLLFDLATIWHLWAFAAAFGVTNSFDSPARQTFVSDMVDEKLMANAVALNSTTFNAARLIGPALAGILIALIGAGWVFVINGGGFLITILGLMIIDRARLRKQERQQGKVRFVEGLKYVKNRPDLLVIMISIFLIGAFTMNFQIFSSTMAVEFGRGAGEYGIISSVLAVGSFVAALIAASRQRARLRVVILSSGLLGVAMAISAVMPDFYSYTASNALIGFASVSTLVTANGYVQTTTPSWVRGRVMTIYMAVLLGGTPLGAPITGQIANTYGPQWAIGVGAIGALVACALGMIWLMASQKMRFRWSRDDRRFVLTRYLSDEIPLDHRFNDTVTFTAPIILPHLQNQPEESLSDIPGGEREIPREPIVREPESDDVAKRRGFRDKTDIRRGDAGVSGFNTDGSKGDRVQGDRAKSGSNKNGKNNN